MSNDRLLQNLQHYRQYSESILQGLNLAKQHPLPNEAWVPKQLPELLKTLQQAAQKAVDLSASSVKIGIMGEFSSGKTLLLGSLIGYGDALPVSESPTTGNVTALHLMQQSDSKTTQLSNFRVSYLTPEKAQQCLAYMLPVAQSRAQAAGVSGSDVAQLASLNVNDRNIWQNLLRWCETVWPNKNLELRYLLRELVDFARTYLVCGAALCGKVLPIDVSTFQQGLELQDLSLDWQDLNFNQLPTPTLNLSSPPKHLSAHILNASFALIRRIDLTVHLSKEIWDLSQLQGTNRLTLLDFPGLGAANSGVRDTYLSLQELAGVQTILILLNGRMPGGDRANQIFTMMQQQRPGEDLKDRILVGVGRFDQLPLESDGGEQALETLIQPKEEDAIFEPQPINDTQVYDQIRVLKNAIASAQAFTNQPNRIVLLSPKLSLAEQSKRLPYEIQVGSPRLLGELQHPETVQSTQRINRKWQQLSQRLPVQSQLGHALSSYTVDGGLTQLRQLLESHVLDHGLAQLHADTHKATQEVRQIKQAIAQQLAIIEQNGLPVPDSPNLQPLIEAIQGLVSVYGQFRTELEQSPMTNRHGIPLSEQIKDDVVKHIFGWREWIFLFNKVKNGSIVYAPVSQSDAFTDIFGDQETDTEPIPIESEDFFIAFKETLLDVNKTAHQDLRDATEAILYELSNRVSEYRKLLRDILPTSLDAQFTKSLEPTVSKKDLASLNRLFKADDPNIYWKQAVLSRSGINEADSLQENWILDSEQIFPLARKDSRHAKSHAFDWNPTKLTTADQAGYHHILITHLRDELIATASLHVAQTMSEQAKKIKSVIFTILDGIIPELQYLLGKDMLLRSIATDQSPSDTPTPKQLQVIAQLVTIDDTRLNPTGGSDAP